MRVLFVVDSPLYWRSGIWLHRVNTPKEALDLRGHGVKMMHLGPRGSVIPNDMLVWPDTVVFGRTYPDFTDPLAAMQQFKKAGKRVVYDIDDDYWSVNPDNPSVLVSSAQKDRYESLMREADAFLTPSPVLAKKLKKISKKTPCFICPNGVSDKVYLDRLNNHEGLVIGYMGAASHWKDLQVVGEALLELNKKHDFMFVIYGFTAEPLDVAIYEYKRALALHLAPEKEKQIKSAVDFFDSTISKLKFHHIPFRPPEMHPIALRGCDFDIAIAPLADNEFNYSKSCIKFYEYAGVGTVTLASDVPPYSTEVNYRAKNTTKDWVNKLEKLIVDAEFRNKILKEQQDWVKKNRSLQAIGLQWELALQRPGGLKVLNQQQ